MKDRAINDFHAVDYVKGQYLQERKMYQYMLKNKKDMAIPIFVTLLENQKRTVLKAFHAYRLLEKAAMKKLITITQAIN